MLMYFRYYLYVTTQKIPKKIFQTFKLKYEDLPNSMKDSINSWRMNNNDYSYHYYDDNQLEKYVTSFNCKDFNFTKEELLKAYYKLKPGAGKADLFRYMIIYEQGGVYMDIDTSCKKPLSSFIRENDDIVSGIGKRGDLHQWGLIYTPKNDIIKKTLELSVHNILNENFVNGYDNSLEGLSGPPCLNVAFQDYSNNTRLQPGIFKIGKYQFNILKGDHFGDNVTFKYKDYKNDLDK
eukprot:gene14455-17084_t